ncbi:MAG: stage III sporulation protein AG [Clostridiales bacterium]|nr:stage III sporulation protein AG [Clostridiales bacterium]
MKTETVTDRGGGLAARAVDFFKGGMGQKLILAAGLAGMALILLSQFWPKRETAPQETARAAVSTEEYVAKTEERLRSLVGGIEGAGRCQVMVTLENGVEYVYASENRINSNREEDSGTNSSKLSQKDDSEQSIILVDTGSGKEGLLVTEIQPTVRGVVVVCDGGDAEEVRRRVTEAVTTALNISSLRVCVVKGTGLT